MQIGPADGPDEKRGSRMLMYYVVERVLGRPMDATPSALLEGFQGTLRRWWCRIRGTTAGRRGAGSHHFCQDAQVVDEGCCVAEERAGR